MLKCEKSNHNCAFFSSSIPLGNNVEYTVLPASVATVQLRVSILILAVKNVSLVLISLTWSGFIYLSV